MSGNPRDAERRAAGRRAGRASRALAPIVLVVVAGFVGAAAAAPAVAPASAQSRDLSVGVAAVQSVDVDSTSAAEARDGFGAEAAPEPEPVLASAPAVGVPDPDTAQRIGYDLVAAYGWGESEWNCLYALWSRESGWNTFAHNASSGAYGIPQALPGEKMASAGADWATNPTTQILWGLGYIQGRYGTPCGAWEHSETVGWY